METPLNKLVKGVIEVREDFARHSNGTDCWAGRVSNDHIQNFITEAYYASMLVEEGRPVLARLALEAKNPSLRFETPLSYNKKNIHKLSPVIDDNQRQIAVEVVGRNGDLQITGLRDPFSRKNLHMTSYIYEPKLVLPHLLLTIHGPARLRFGPDVGLEFHVDSIRPLARLSFQDEGVFPWILELERLIANGIPQIQNTPRLPPRHILFNVLDAIARRVELARHGGTIIVLPHGKDQCSSIKTSYPIDQSRILRNAVDDYYEYYPYLKQLNFIKLQNEHGETRKAIQAHQQLDNAVRMIASLANVDGAVVLNSEMIILGYGAKIGADQRAPSTKLERMQRSRKGEDPAQWKETDEDAMGMGMRHRSAINLSADLPGAIIFVFSQDGGIKLVHRETDTSPVRTVDIALTEEIADPGG